LQYLYLDNRQMEIVNERDNLPQQIRNCIYLKN
jgi:hypothetical protein